MLYIVEGPDRSGKTSVGKAFAERLKIPYFKPNNDGRHLHDNEYSKKMLRYCDPYMAEFCKTMRVSCVIDRHYVTEWVYSHVLGRDVDEEGVWNSDRLFADVPATILIFKRASYDGVSDSDPRLDSTTLQKLADKYEEFAARTECVSHVFVFDRFDLPAMLESVLSRMGAQPCQP